MQMLNNRPLYSYTVEEIMNILNLSLDELKATLKSYSMDRGQSASVFSALWSKWSHGGNMSLKMEDYISEALNLSKEEVKAEEPQEDPIARAIRIHKEEIIAEYVAQNPCTCRSK